MTPDPFRSHLFVLSCLVQVPPPIRIMGMVMQRLMAAWAAMFIMIRHVDRLIRHRRKRHRSEIFGSDIGRANVGRSDIGRRHMDGCHIHWSYIYGSDVGSAINRIHFEFLLNQVDINVCPYRTPRHSLSINGRGFISVTPFRIRSTSGKEADTYHHDF
jgi:hypothetical protein